MAKKPEKNQPPADPLIDEVREIRRQLSERFGNDVDKLCDHLQEIEREHADRVVREVPKGRRRVEG